MKRIAIGVCLLFLLATVGTVFGEANSTKEVVVYEKCRIVSCDFKGAISYGIYDIKANKEIDEVCAKGYLDLIDVLKDYEQQNSLKLQWSYRDKGIQHGNYATPCIDACRNAWVK